jgi:uncharacterized DUF497 family protein
VFSWDPKKAKSNLEKHGISFDQSATVFGDVEALDWIDEEHSSNEPRRKRLGTSETGHILLVVYTIRERENEETIRIISARQASRKERQAYRGL